MHVVILWKLFSIPFYFSVSVVAEYRRMGRYVYKLIIGHPVEIVCSQPSMLL